MYYLYGKTEITQLLVCEFDHAAYQIIQEEVDEAETYMIGGPFPPEDDMDAYLARGGGFQSEEQPVAVDSSDSDSSIDVQVA